MVNTIKRILLVEDNPDTCALVAHVLKDYVLEVVHTKADALLKAAREKYSLVLLDYYLPDGTGEEACRELRKFDHRTPILFVTSSATFSETRARSIGAQGTLKKGNPLFLSELRNRTTELAAA